MADSSDKPADKPAKKPESEAAATKQQAPQIEVDDSNASTSYANFCRVTGTPEELIVDFGLNSQPMGLPQKPLIITQRLIVNYYTAKRLLSALHMSVQRHEAAFGVLETDIRKRVLPQTPAAGGGSGSGSS